MTELVHTFDPDQFFEHLILLLLLLFTFVSIISEM